MNSSLQLQPPTTTKTQRYVEFDNLRVAALFLILACHFVRSIGFYQLDLPLGAIGNLVFFTMSGWLLGLAWNAKGCPAYGFSFLKRRWLRLAIPLWVFAVPYLIYAYFYRGGVEIMQILLNLTLLNWFARIPGMTPFWFITAIAVFYVIALVISKIAFFKQRNILPAVVLSVVFVSMQIALTICGIRFGYILIMVLLGSLAFVHAEKLLALTRRVPKKPVLSVLFFIIAFLMLWYAYYRGWIMNGSPSGYWAACVASILFVVMIFSVLSDKVIPGVSYLSRISYEIYLVHAALLLWFRPIFDSIVLYAIVFLICSIVGGSLIHWLANIRLGGVK